MRIFASPLLCFRVNISISGSSNLSECISLHWLQVHWDDFLPCNGGEKLGGVRVKFKAKWWWICIVHQASHLPSSIWKVERLPRDKWVKQCKLRVLTPMDSGPVYSRGVMKTLTVLLSEASGVKCLADGCWWIKAVQSILCTNVSCSQPRTPLGKELSEPLWHCSAAGPFLNKEELLGLNLDTTEKK